MNKQHDKEDTDKNNENASHICFVLHIQIVKLKQPGVQGDFCKIKCLDMLTVLPDTNGLQIFGHILMLAQVTGPTLTRQCSFMCYFSSVCVPISTSQPTFH